MVQRLSLEQRDGQTVVVKRASDPPRRRLLAHEALQLGSLQHPGVVGLVSFSEGDGHDTLVTRCAGTVTLADYSPADFGAVAGVVAGVASVVADLHATGLCHGGLQADHIIIGGTRHAVLCSFGLSGPLSRDTVGVDVAGLGEVVESLMARARKRNVRGTRRQERELRAIATRCRNQDTTASEVAAMLAAVPGAMPADAGVQSTSGGRAVDDASVADDQGVDLVRPAPTRLEGTRTWRDRVPPDLGHVDGGRPRLLPVVGGLVLAVLVVGGMALSGRRASDPVPPSVITASTTTPQELPTASQATVATPSSAPLAIDTICAVQIEAGIDTDGDGCADDVTVDGNLIRISSTWYVAGSPGDIAVVGDWDCDGVATAAVLRPTSGEIFVFDAWAPDSSAIEVTPAASVEGATQLEVRRSRTCDLLYAVDEVGVASPDPVDL